MRKAIGHKDKLYLHMMRHTFATRWIEAGMPLKDVSEFLGHLAVKTTEICTKITPDHLINSFNRYSSENMSCQ
ncbi:tyrosine-type recombinase/integrase [Desulforhopalus singaporensis]|uniref:Phage integrase family protein n=1 Tax=Desulforhopalus singaporensis TaxID=91360 RepID=A0A1H0Q0S6_9BACT|nr:Phage integrase family protein [Desulforhopalus singaporensis]